MKIDNELITFTIIAIVLASGLSYYYITGTASGTDSAMVGVPLDDTYIHFQYAKNLATYGKFYYNVGDEQTGATSPLWVIILGIVYKLGFDLISTSKIIGLFFHICSSIILFSLLRRYVKNKTFAWLGGIVCLISPTLFFYSLSGMEVSLFVFLLLIIFRFFIQKKYDYVGVSLGFGILTRPEALILFGALLLFAAWKKEKKMIKIFILAIIISAPWFIYCFLITGRPLPSTFYAKTESTGEIPLINAVLVFFWPVHEILFALGTMVIFYGVIIKEYIKIFQDELKFFFAFTIVYLLMFVVLPIKVTPDKNMLITPYFSTALSRYISPVLVFLNFFMITGIDFLLEKRKPAISKFSRTLTYILIAILITETILMLPQFADKYSWDTNSISSQQVIIAKWIEQNIPQETRIGLNDAGAIIYYSSLASDHIFVDLVGLNTHQRIGRNLYEFIREEKLEYLVIYDEWFPDMKTKFELEEIYNVTLEYNTVAGADTMHVYRIK